MSKPFALFAESYITRYTNGGFLTQDTVILTKTFKSDKQFKKLHKYIQQAIIDLFDQGLNVRVIDVVSKHPNGEGNDLSAKGTQMFAIIAPEIMPGKCDNGQAITVPTSILEVQSAYPNLPKIPKKFMYEFEEIIKPIPYQPKDSAVESSEEEVKMGKGQSNLDTRKTQQGKSLKKSDTELKNKNIKIAKESVQCVGDPIMESYLEGLVD